MKDEGLDFYFNSGALANMQAGGSASYYGYADKNWPAIQVRGISSALPSSHFLARIFH
jgi:hypothetical protein